MNAYKYSVNYLYFQSCEFDPDVIRYIKDPIFGNNKYLIDSKQNPGYVCKTIASTSETAVSTICSFINCFG